MANLDRRRFLKIAAAAHVAGVSQSTAHAADRNSIIRAAVLGLNGRGTAHIDTLEKMKGVEVVCLCDPDEKVLHTRADDLAAAAGRAIARHTDLREVLDRRDIDVVTIATPNHWHALATIWACQAGKDVYVEKPGSHNLFEGQRMVNAARKYNRIVQHGVQLRSNPALQEAVQKLRDGIIGDVYMARGIVYRWRPSVGKVPDSQPPAHLDWNLWQGPAEERRFSERYVHYNWHWHWDYGNGDIGNQGVHETDMCLWGLGVDFPTEISATGGKYLWDDDKQTPEVLNASFSFAGNMRVEFEVRPWATNTESDLKVGNIFYGSDGILIVRGFKGYKTFFGKTNEPGPERDGGDPLQAHFENFIQAVQARKSKLLNGPVETAHSSSALAHLGNIAYRLGRRLNFSPETQQFVSDSEADRYLTREYREPFVVPDVV